MQVLMEFATPIGVFEIDRSLCKEYAEYIKKIAAAQEPGGHQFYQFMYTTPDDLHNRIEFFPIINLIKYQSKQFCESVIGVDFSDLTLTCMWGNCHSNFSFHGSHSHPNSFLSGVLYLNVPDCEQPGKLSFIDPRPAKNMTYANFQKNSCVSNRNIYVTPSTGTFLLFPSWLEHSTDIFVSDTEEQRISISFNFNLNRCDYHTMRF